LSLSIPFRAFKTVPKDFQQRVSEAGNESFMIHHEMLPCVNYQPDTKELKQNGVRVFMAAGQMTLDKRKFYGRTAPILADMLGCKMVTFPGHHISYFDMPEEWSEELCKILKESC